MESPKPVIGVLCCNEFAERPVQCVASRFIEPLARLSNATVLLVPALIDTLDARALGERLDGLLLTGSRSNVDPALYGGLAAESSRVDAERDEVSLALASHLIEIGRPVFGICRGLQELNVLFGGTLQDTGGDIHHTDDDVAFEDMFSHGHEVRLTEGGRLTRATGLRQARVNSVHRQGVSRLGSGLAVEAVASDDGLVEAFSSRPCGGDVLAVQWHPEWETSACPASHSFFALFGSSVRTSLAAA